MLEPVYAEGDTHAFLWKNRGMDIYVQRGSFWISLPLLKPITAGVWCTLDLVWWPLKIKGHQELLRDTGCFNLVLLDSTLSPLHPSSLPLPLPAIEYEGIVRVRNGN